MREWNTHAPQNAIATGSRSLLCFLPFGNEMFSTPNVLNERGTKRKSRCAWAGLSHEEPSQTYIAIAFPRAVFQEGTSNYTFCIFLKQEGFSVIQDKSPSPTMLYAPSDILDQPEVLQFSEIVRVSTALHWPTNCWASFRVGTRTPMVFPYASW